MVVVNRKDKRKTCLIIYIPYSDDNWIKEKEQKLNNYGELKWEIGRLWSMKKTDVIPIVFGALRNICTPLPT